MTEFYIFEFYIVRTLLLKQTLRRWTELRVIFTENSHLCWQEIMFSTTTAQHKNYVGNSSMLTMEDSTLSSAFTWSFIKPIITCFWRFIITLGVDISKAEMISKMSRVRFLAPKRKTIKKSKVRACFTMEKSFLQKKSNF